MAQHCCKSLCYTDSNFHAFVGAHKERESIMNDEPFGERFNYNLAEGAAMSGSNPVRLATAIGTDLGKMIFGALGSGAKPENHPEMCSQSADIASKASLRVRSYN